MDVQKIIIIFYIFVLIYNRKLYRNIVERQVKIRVEHFKN